MGRFERHFIAFALLSASGCGGADPGMVDPNDPNVGSPGPVAGGGSSTATAGVGGQPMPPFGDPPPPCEHPVGVSSNAVAIPPVRPRVLDEPAVQLTPTPPAISGGTLLALPGGQALVASDPDRDLVYVVDVAGAALRATIELEPGDEPGRAVQDALHRVHVVLRGAGELALIDPAAGTLLERRAVCELPRGIAYDAATDAIHVACAEGRLITLSATLGVVTRTLELPRDLRDVVVSNGELLVTRFRSAELLRIDAGGAVAARVTPASATRGKHSGRSDACGAFIQGKKRDQFTPTVAWRMQALPAGGVALLHQRSQSTEVQIQSGGYGGGVCNVGIVQSVITLDAANPASSARAFPTLQGLTLAVDLAVDPSGEFLAVAVPGTWTVPNTRPIRLFARASLEQSARDAAQLAADVDRWVATPLTDPVTGAADPTALEDLMEGCQTDNGLAGDASQVTAVAFLSAQRLAVQTREPAALELYQVADLVAATAGTAATPVPVVIALSEHTRHDTGHDLFHLRAGAGIACASCHAEGGDDGHVWDFAEIGPRRTQHVRGGIVGTEPLHWGGDMQTFDQLANEVFVERMGGSFITGEQVAAAQRWIDLQPALSVAPRDAAAVERGRALFASESVGCSECHAGATLTNNMTVDVGTGGALQVPSLRGLAFRAPYMHDGCAPTLQERFGPCGGDAHGKTSQLDAAEVSDLIAYLETL